MIVRRGSLGGFGQGALFALACLFPLSSIAAEAPAAIAAVEAPAADAPSSKVLNRTLFTPPAGMEAGEQIFLTNDMRKPLVGACEKVPAHAAYVEEMLVNIDSIGSPGGKTYQRRVALVVGNSAYPGGNYLPNPKNDATSIAKLMHILGFDVYYAADVKAAALESCLSKFKADLEAKPADVALFYYAGHGVQLTSQPDGTRRNYMLSVDAKVDASGKGYGFKQIDAVLDEMRAHAKQSVFLYDACRSAPEGVTDVIKEADGKPVTRQADLDGAAQVEVKSTDSSSAPQLFIAYATSPGKTADDAGPNNSKHSPFTQALLNNLPTPGLSIGEALDAAFFDVGELTGGQQTPWTSSSLQERLKLNGAGERAEAEIASRDLAARAASLRGEGLKGASIVAALKSLPLEWRAGEQLTRRGRVELYKSMTADVMLESRFGNEAGIGSATFSADGKFVFALGVRHQSGLSAYDAATGRALYGSSPVEFSINPSEVFARPDGKQVAYLTSLARCQVFVSPVMQIDRGPFAPVGDPVDAAGCSGAFVYSADSRFFATAAYNGSHAEIWNAETLARATRLNGHSARVNAVSFSHDGAVAATASDDKTARVWNSATGVSTSMLTRESKLLSVAISPKGASLKVAVGDEKGEIAVWNVATGKIERTLLQPSGRPNEVASVDNLAWRPDGRYLVSSSKAGGSLVIWDTEKGMAALQDLETRFPGEMRSFASFSPDGRQLVTGGSTRLISLGDTLAAAQPARIFSLIDLPIRSWRGHSKPVRKATLDRNGKTAATASDDGTVRIVDATSGTERRRIDIGQPVKDVAFNTAGDRIVTAAEESAAIWNIASGVKVQSFDGHRVSLATRGQGASGMVNSAAFSPDGKQIVTASDDKTARVWDAVTGALLRSFQHDEPVLTAGFIGEGERIFTISSGGEDDLSNRQMRLWDAQSGAELPLALSEGEDGWSRISGPNLAISPDGRSLFSNHVSEGPAAFLCDIDRAECAGFETSGGGVFSADGRFIASTGVMRDAFTAEVLNSRRLDIESEYDIDVYNYVWTIEFSADGSRIVSGTKDGSVNLWDSGLYGLALQKVAYGLLTDEQRVEVERERIRHWELDPALLE